METQDPRSLELDTITQNWLDTYNWYGTLNAIAFNLENKSERKIILKAIALLETDLTVKETLKKWELKQIIQSLLTNAKITGHRVKCPIEVENALTSICN